MKVNVFRNFLLCLICLSGPSLAANKEIAAEEYVNAIFSAVKRSWPVLENAWDTPLYRQLRLIVADDHQAWAVDSKALTRIPYPVIQQRQLAVEYMYFQPIPWPDGRPTLYVSLGATLPREETERFDASKEAVPTLFNVATHEAFHFFVQDHVWKRTAPDNETRATPYPVQSPPRFYRNSIIRALYATLRGDPDGLGHARYWFDRWKTQYPDDAHRIRQSDIDEGSARYIETTAEMLAQGQSLNTEGFQRALIAKFQQDENVIYTKSDSESYPIGALSGFIMNMRKMQWQQDVISGTPPLDILLKNITPIKPPVDTKLEHAVAQDVHQLHHQVGTAITHFENAYHRPGIIKIFVSSELPGSYSLSGGFFRTQTIPYDLRVGLSASANWPGGHYRITEAVAASVEHANGFRGKRGFFILYAGQLPASNKGRLILKTEQLSLDIPYPKDVDKSHVIYLP